MEVELLVSRVESADISATVFAENVENVVLSKAPTGLVPIYVRIPVESADRSLYMFVDSVDILVLSVVTISAVPLIVEKLANCCAVAVESVSMLLERVLMEFCSVFLIVDTLLLRSVNCSCVTGAASPFSWP